MLNTEQVNELVIRVKSAISKRYPGIADDKFQRLYSTVLSQAYTWKHNPAKTSDPIPSIAMLKVIARRHYAREFFGHQQEIEESNRTDNRSPEDFNMTGEHSEYDSPYYQDCSYEFLQEEAGFEVETDSYEQILLNNHEEDQINARINNQIIAFTSNYFVPKHLRDCIKHVKAGGQLTTFAQSIGMSDQTLANQLKTALKNVNHAQQSLFSVDKDEVATVVKVEVAEPVKAVRRSYSKNQRRISDEQNKLDF